jgi:predicted dehydrogenase
MEAVMYRFHPRTRRAKELVTSELGDVISVSSSFTFLLEDDPENVRLQPELGGGSLMDVGCYAVNAARLFLGVPDSVYAASYDSRGCGVDTRLSAVMEYDAGATARIGSGFDTPERDYYRVATTDGWLEATGCFLAAPDEEVSLTYSVGGRTATETFDPVDHYQLEVEQFAAAVEAGETPMLGREEAVDNMRVIDALYESASTGAPVNVR